MLTNRRSTLMIPSPSSSNNRLSPSSTHPGILGTSRPDQEPHCTAPSILTSTLPSLPGHRVVSVLGAVYGATTYALKDSKALLKAAPTGAEVRYLTHTTYGARDQAVERLTRDCVARGANAVVGLVFDEKHLGAAVAGGFVQVSVSGTAVYVERERQQSGNPFSPE